MIRLSRVTQRPAGLSWRALSCGLSLALCSPLAALAGPSVSTAKDGWDFSLSGAQLTTLCEQTLAQARAAFTTIENDTAAPTLARIYGSYDAMQLDLQRIQHMSYMSSVHPDPSVQTAAEACISDRSDFGINIRLSVKFYQRVAAIDLTQVTPAERLMVEKQLRSFRQAGIDRDEATRNRVRALVAEISELGIAFKKNIRDDLRTVATNAAQLHGLPQDFLDSHPADAQGNIQISTDYPDYFPVMTYAADDDVRRRLFFADKNIATPINSDVLRTLIQRRHELATLLNYDSHAQLAMDDLMIGTPQQAQRFLDSVSAAVKQPAAREMGVLLARLQQIDPAAKQVQAWQSYYLAQLVRAEDYALDAAQVREYFRFDKVQAGIFELTENLFGVQIVPWQTRTWHPDVTAWEMREGGQAIARFYLDMHPRPNKYKHAAHWTLRTGLKDRQIPLSGLAANVPTGLLEHRSVSTFLHEFGHLLHNSFSGTQRWLDISGMSMERDFIEAPSQMLEEWIWDYDTLRRFATNDKGEPIPRALVSKMQRARYFGVATATAGQVFYANLALNLYQRKPDSFQLLPLLQQLQGEYSPYPYVPDTHFYNNFGHLYGYSSNYYMYQWSKAISTDMLDTFSAAGLHNNKVAADYRRQVLAAAGSKPATDMLEEFLGRPFSTTAYSNYLKQLN